jgi:DNA-binding NtrC family response regulator
MYRREAPHRKPLGRVLDAVSSRSYGPIVPLVTTVPSVLLIVGVAASPEGPRRSVPEGTLRDSPSARTLEHAPLRHGLALVGDCDAPAFDVARMIWFHEIDRVRIGRGKEFAAEAGAGELNLRIPDGHASGRHARIERTPQGWQLFDERSSNGTRVEGRPVGQHLLRPGELLETGRTFWRFVEYQRRHELGTDQDSVEIAPTRTISPAFVEDLQLVHLAAGGPEALLLLGPTGSGKERLANQIHQWSTRSGGYHAFNCAAISESLAEDQLFGHKKGAFYGADSDREGLIEAASGGTLLLDEFGDLSPKLQAGLLRAVGEHEVIRLGDTKVRKVDVRFLAATNRELSTCGGLRPDLLARFQHRLPRLPALRERREDLGILIAHVLRTAAPERAEALKMDPAVYRRLLGHAWPQNIRELEMALALAVRVCGASPVIRPAHVDLADDAPPASKATPPRRPAPGADPPDRVELLAALEEARWNVAKVARRFGLHREQVYRLMKEYNLGRPE